MSNLPHQNLESRQMFVVENFGGEEVSWAQSYTGAASDFGFKILPTVDRSTRGDKIFLGDSLPFDLGSGSNLYFLGAADGTEAEQDASQRCELTTTVSTHERNRLLGFFPRLEEDRVSVEGFPVFDKQKCDALVASVSERPQETVAFLGRAAADKGPALELKIAEELVRSGVSVFHFSNTTVPIATELRSVGVRVEERISGNEYIRALALMRCVVNTSPRESLFVSGVEASALGVPVFAVDNQDSGIRDWNVEDRFYNPADVSGLVDAVKSVLSKDPKDIAIPDVSRYQIQEYFNGIIKRIAESRDE